MGGSQLDKTISIQEEEEENTHGLRQAARQGDIERIRELFQNNTDVDSHSTDERTPLAIAVLSDNIRLATALLEEFKADVNIISGAQGRTALHESTDIGNYDMVHLILEAGGHLDVQDEAGWTPLMLAVQKSHVDVVRLLLGRNADRHLINKDGDTAAKISIQTNKKSLQKMLATPVLTGPQITGDSGPVRRPPAEDSPDQEGSSSPELSSGKKETCKGFTATCVHFFTSSSEERIEKDTSVYELLYGAGPRATMKQATPIDMEDRQPSFRWYHLSANNLEWVEALIQRHLSGLEKDPGKQLVQSRKNRIGLRRLNNKSDVTCKRPGCHVVPGAIQGREIQGREDIPVVVTFMPYLHFESERSVKEMGAVIEAVRNAKDGQAVPGAKLPAQENYHSRLINSYMTDPGLSTPLQPRRTLDQYFYRHLRSDHRQQWDQVVARSAEGSSLENLFMVDQLWMWIINGDTVITCFPAQWDCWDPSHKELSNSMSKVTEGTSRPGKKGVKASNTPEAKIDMGPVPYRRRLGLDLRRSILDHLKDDQRAPLTSAYAFAAVVVSLASNVFDPEEIADRYQFFDIFEKAVGKNAQLSAEILVGFNALDSETDLDLDEEIPLLVEVEDMRDELDILKMVLEDQKEVARKLDKALLGFMPADKLLHRKDGDWDRVRESHLARIARMNHITNRTIQSLYRVMDLKQKNASVAEAAAMKSEAAALNRGANEQASHSRTLTLFTIVTIIFLPLSFMAAFFAINIDVFPTNQDGKMELGYVVEYMVGISLALSLPFVFVAFNQELCANILSGLVDWILFWPQTMINLAVFLAVLITTWVLDLSTTVSVALTVTTVIIIVVYCMYMSTDWFIERATRTSTEPSVAGSLGDASELILPAGPLPSTTGSVARPASLAPAKTGTWRTGQGRGGGTRPSRQSMENWLEAGSQYVAPPDLVN